MSRDKNKAHVSKDIKELQQKIMDMTADLPWARNAHRDDDGGVYFEMHPRNKAEGRQFITTMFGEKAWFEQRGWKDFPNEPLTEDEAEYVRLHMQ